MGKAYELIRSMVTKGKIKSEDCAIALISDGEATDDYKKALAALDAQNRFYRVAISIGNESWTTLSIKSGNFYAEIQSQRHS